jgi:hypothetical protein
VTPLYESLLNEAEQQGIYTYEKPMSKRIKGLYADGVICINRNLPTSIAKCCILAEELGHYYTSFGDILDQSKLQNRQQELRARHWSYSKLVPLNKLIEAYKLRIQGRHELAEYLEITEEFLQDAIDHYHSKYGTYTVVGNYTVYFNPLGVMEMFDK